MEVLKATGKPVAASMCIGPQGDMHGVTPAECAVRLVKAGGCAFNQELKEIRLRNKGAGDF